MAVIGATKVSSRVRAFLFHGGLLLGAVGGIAFGFVWPFRPDTDHGFLLIPLALLIVGVALALFGAAVPDHPRLDRASELLQTEGTRLHASPDEIIVAAALLLNQKDHNQRIIHDVEPGDGFLINRVTRYMTLPSIPGFDEDAAYYIPLGYFTRGTLLDDLVATTDKVPLRVVPSGAAAELVLQVLSLITQGRAAPQSLEEHQHLSRLVGRMFPAIRSDGEAASEQDLLAAPRQAVRELSQMSPPGGRHGAWRAGWDAVLNLWLASLSSYIIFGQVRARAGTELAITVSYKVQLGDDLEGADDTAFEGEPAKTSRKKNLLRAIVGVRRSVHRFHLQYERETTSYHLRFIGPDDQYVSHVEVGRAGGGDPAHLITMRSDDTSTVHYRHIHVRPLKDVAATGQLFARFGMRERPPGMLGLVALVGIMQLVFEAVILVYYDRVFAPGGTLRGDAATILLAAPAIVSGWMANQISPGRLQRMALTAVMGIAWNGFSAVFFTVLALLATLNVDVGHVAIGHLTVRHALWTALIGVGIWATATVAGHWFASTKIFVGRLRRGPAIERFTR
jgi:hypothetical protein